MKASPFTTFTEHSESMNQYMNLIKKHPVLTAERERKLIIDAKNGDMKARDELIYSNLGMCIKIAKNWAGNDIKQEDLINAAIEGLIKAIDNFDPKSENRLYAYAEMRVVDAIQNTKEKLRKGMVIGHRAENLVAAAKKLRNTLEQEYGRDVTDYEVWYNLPDKYKLSYPDYCTLNSNGGSLDDEIGKDGNDSFTVLDKYNSPNDDDILTMLIDKEAKNYISKCVASLPSSTMREVVARIYGLFGFGEMEKKEIAKELNISTECLRQNHNKALAILRTYLLDKQAC